MFVGNKLTLFLIYYFTAKFSVCKDFQGLDALSKMMEDLEKQLTGEGCTYTCSNGN